MSNIREHLKKVREKQSQKRTTNNRGENIWHSWKASSNKARFVGDFILTKTHYIGNNSKISNLALFEDAAFQGENRLSVVINCANWDIEKEEYKKNGPCLVCKLNKIAREVLKSNQPGEEDTITSEMRKEFADLKARTDNRSAYRWNILDRDNPDVAEGKAGFKITSLGQELFDQLSAIHDGYAPNDFTSVDLGLDISVKRTGGGDSKERVKYSAQPAMLDGKLCVTPLSDEEKAYEQHVLLGICGRQADQELLVSKLLEKWTSLIEAVKQNESAAATANNAGPSDDKKADSDETPEATESTDTKEATAEEDPF